MTARTVTIYKNGDTYFPGKKLVVNNRQIRSFDSFLDKVTRTVRNPVAIRSIRTPNHGTELASLDKFEDGGMYVAVGQERFKKLDYSTIQGFQHHTPSSWRKTDEPPPLKPIRTRFTNATARHLQVGEDDARRNRIINVYRNGDANHPSVRLLLDKRTAASMENVLQYVTNKVKLQTGAVKNLYDLEGRLVEKVDVIESGGKYVAVGFGKSFRPLAYENIVMKSNITPRKMKFVPKKPPQLAKGLNQEKYKEFKDKKRSELDASLDVVDKSASDDSKDDDKDDENNWFDDIVDKIEDAVEKSPSPEPVADRLQKSPTPDKSPSPARSALNTPDPDDIDDILDLGTTQTLAANTDDNSHDDDELPTDDRDNSPRKAVPAGPAGPEAFEHAVSTTQKSLNNSAQPQDGKKSLRSSRADEEPGAEMESFRKAASNASSRASVQRSSRTRTITKSTDLKEEQPVEPLNDGEAGEPVVELPQDGRASADNARLPSADTARLPSAEGRVSAGGDGAYKASGIEAESGTAINDSKDTTLEPTIDDVAAEEVDEEVEEEVGEVAADAPVEAVNANATAVDGGTSYIA